ncbi:hypothetical protein WMF26_42780 [Sorangium sp. So ce185]
MDSDDPQAYALGESEVPWVEVPDITEVEGAFDEGRDPYAAYADAVIAALEADVSGGVVVARADFLTVSAQNKLILSEVKTGRNVEGGRVIEQLSSGMEGVRQRGLAGDVEKEVELIVERGAKFGGDTYVEQGGYLFDTNKDKRATLNGFNRPIKVIRL